MTDVTGKIPMPEVSSLIINLDTLEVLGEDSWIRYQPTGDRYVSLLLDWEGRRLNVTLSPDSSGEVIQHLIDTYAEKK